MRVLSPLLGRLLPRLQPGRPCPRPPGPPFAEGGFLLGANLPWLRYGGDFGASAWFPEGGVARRREEADAALAFLADRGFSLVRWWVLGDGRCGLLTRDDGEVEGVEPHVWPDLDAALDLARRRGVQLLPVLFDFLLPRPGRVHGGVAIGGRRRALLAHGRERLLDRVLSPLLARYGEHPAVVAWDLFNEPEWATLGLGGRPGEGAVGPLAMRRFLARAVEAAQASASQPVTVGLAGEWGLPLVRGLGLDLYEVHWYDASSSPAALEAPVSRWGLERPVLLGEFPTRGSRRTPDAIVSAARRAGFAGALAWSLRADDESSGGAEALGGGPDRQAEPRPGPGSAART